MLIIGNFGLSVTQARAQMALWSMMAAPLLMGNDLRNLAPEMKAVLLADEVIAVDQDPLGRQGWRVKHTNPKSCDAHDIWMRPLAGGDVAVALWNRGFCGTPSLLTVNWIDIGLPPAQPMTARNLFLRKDLGVFTGNLTGLVDIDDVLIVRLSKPAAAAEPGRPGRGH